MLQLKRYIWTRNISWSIWPTTAVGAWCPCKLECVERQKEEGRRDCMENGGRREGEWSVGRNEGGRMECREGGREGGV